MLFRSGRTIERIDIFDAVPVEPAADARVRTTAGDIADPAAAARLVTRDTGFVFHLAAVVSAGAEADFDLGMRVNLDGTRRLLEAARRDRKSVVEGKGVSVRVNLGGRISIKTKKYGRRTKIS